MAKTRVLICPYCGETQPAGETCRSCGGLFEPLSRQATHNEMGPWFIRDVNRPFQPGCSYETLIKLIERGQVNKFSIIRGPTTKQFWTIARRVPGVSHLLGYCHSCDASVDVGDHGCHACGVPFGAYLDRNYLGLPEITPLPWEASHDDDELRREPASSRTMDFRRAAEPLGISSFASDEELRATGLPGQTMRGGPAGVMGAGSGAMATMPSAIPVADLDTRQSLSEAISVRAAEHKIQDQRRTIIMLAIALVAVTLVAIAGALWMLRRADIHDGAGTAAQHAATSPANSTSPSSINEQAAASPARAADAGATPAASQPSAARANMSAQEVQAEYEHARRLADAGAKEDRPLDERIQAYEQAQKILQEIDARAAAENKPADLTDQLSAIDRALNDLRLKSYFP